MPTRPKALAELTLCSLLVAFDVGAQTSNLIS
jgi:hypothetical protein